MAEEPLEISLTATAYASAAIQTATANIGTSIQSLTDLFIQDKISIDEFVASIGDISIAQAAASPAIDALTGKLAQLDQQILEARGALSSSKENVAGFESTRAHGEAHSAAAGIAGPATTADFDVKQAAAVDDLAAAELNLANLQKARKTVQASLSAESAKAASMTQEEAAAQSKLIAAN